MRWRKKRATAVGLCVCVSSTGTASLMVFTKAVPHLCSQQAFVCPLLVDQICSFNGASTDIAHWKGSFSLQLYIYIVRVYLQVQSTLHHLQLQMEKENSFSLLFSITYDIHASA